MKAKRRKIIHACACCKQEFPSRKACWAHLDAGCPKKPEPVTPINAPFRNG